MLLALDVGFANMGWVLFDQGKVYKCGVIQTEKSHKKGTRVADDHAYRAGILTKELNSIISNYGVRGIIGELPSGGAQNARAMGFMMSAITVASAVGTIWDLPMEWCTPTDLKKAITGKRSASKEEIMDKMKEMFFKDEIIPFTKGQFEHIADACGVYLTLKNDNLVKMFGR